MFSPSFSFAGRPALLRIVLVAVAVVLATSLRPPEPASAVDHIAEIHEVMVGFDGDPEVQYVEVNMRAFGQNATTGVKLSAFDASGTFIDADPITEGNQPLLTVSGFVPNSGAGVRWLMGTAAFEAASGIQADFEYPPSPVLPASAGMVCLFENLRDFTNPTQSIDCVAYGGAAFTGSNPNSSPSEAATSGPGDGQLSLTRTGPSTFNYFGPPWALSNDANDFALATPSPENNAGEVGSLVPVPLTPTPTPTVTLTPTVTPTKQPDGDTDGDTIPNDVDPDDDNDGCTDVQELGANQNSGGKRNPHSFWDFFDVWTHPIGQPTLWERDKVVTIVDILGVAGRFGANDSGPGTFDRNGDPLTTPNPATGTPRERYHPSYDRGPIVGANNWDVAPADGAINLVDDILGTARQFGHNCL